MGTANKRAEIYVKERATSGRYSLNRTSVVPRTTVREKAKQFVIEGMLGLVDQRAAAAGEREISFPDPIAKYILYLKHLYPPIHYREIVRIIGKKFGYQTDHHKVNLRTIQTTR